MTRRPHVLQVFQPGIGGVPAYVAHLAAGLRELGWRVSVAAPAGHSAAAQVEHLAEASLVIDCGNGWSPRADARAVRTLTAFACREGVDVVHGHSSKASLLAAIVARRAGRPSVYTPHTWAFQRGGGALAAAAFAAIEALLARRYHRRIVTVSESEARAAERWRVARGDRLLVVPSGLPNAGRALTRDEARRVLGLDDARPIVAWLARLDRAKRPEDLGPLASRLGHGAYVVALGQQLPDSPQGRALERAGGRVLRNADPRVLLAAADVLVLTSAWEASPLCVLEAMRASLPVVAYDVGDLSAQIVHGGSGFLARPFDLDELTRRVRQLVEDPALRAEFGAAGRMRLSERFSYAAMVGAIDGVYRDAVAPPSDPPTDQVEPMAAASAGQVEVTG